MKRTQLADAEKQIDELTAKLAAANARVAVLEAAVRDVCDDSTNLDKWRTLEFALAQAGDAGRSERWKMQQ